MEKGSVSGLWGRLMGNGTWALHSHIQGLPGRLPTGLSHVTDPAEQAPLKALRENSFSGDGTQSGSRNGLIKSQPQFLPHSLA